MTIDAISKRLVELCRQGKYEDAQNELYSNEAESLEPSEMPGMESVKGLDGIKKKGEQFNQMVEAIHGGAVSDPVIAGNKFAISLVIDATMKGKGRQNLAEICVYTVKDGKIVKEQFF